MARFYTGHPKVDARFPHFAPVLGAQPLVHEPGRGLESVLGDAEPDGVPSQIVAPDPWPEVSVGVATAALSGGLVGGIAAGHWPGASIGAGLSTAAWSVFTLFGSFHDLGPRARTVLGGAAVTGVLMTGLGFWLRGRR